MDSERILKAYLKPKRYTVVLGVVLLAVSLVSLVLGLTAGGKEADTPAKPFNPIAEAAGEYCYLDIVAISDWLYNYDGAIYYTAFDAGDYTYTVRLNDAQFASMAAQYDCFVNGSDTSPAPFRVYGVSQKATTNIIDAVSSAWSITEQEYPRYFGTMFLNATTSPGEEAGALWFLAALFTFLFALMLLGMGGNSGRIAKKSLRRIEERGELDMAAAELEDPDNETYLKGGLRLGEHYLFSKSGAALRYEDILWCFTRVTRYGLIGLSTVIIANTATAKEIPLTGIGRGKSADEIVDAVMATLAEKNPDVLLGFTNENRKAYKAIVKGETV